MSARVSFQKIIRKKKTQPQAILSPVLNLNETPELQLLLIYIRFIPHLPSRARLFFIIYFKSTSYSLPPKSPKTLYSFPACFSVLPGCVNATHGSFKQVQRPPFVFVSKRSACASLTCVCVRARQPELQIGSGVHACALHPSKVLKEGGVVIKRFNRAVLAPPI